MKTILIAMSLMFATVANAGNFMEKKIGNWDVWGSNGTINDGNVVSPPFCEAVTSNKDGVLKMRIYVTSFAQVKGIFLRGTDIDPSRGMINVTTSSGYRFAGTAIGFYGIRVPSPGEFFPAMLQSKTLTHNSIGAFTTFRLKNFDKVLTSFNKCIDYSRENDMAIWDSFTKEQIEANEGE